MVLRGWVEPWWRGWGFVSFVVLSRVFGLRLDGGYCLGVGGGRLPRSYVFDGRILLFPLDGKDGRYLYRAWSGHIWAVWFLFCFTWNLLGMFVSRRGGRWVA